MSTDPRRRATRARAEKAPARTRHDDARTAHHEAGHMVVAYAIGLRVTYASIERVEEADYEGATQIEAGRATRLQRLAQTLAGHAAELAFHSKHVVNHPEQDQDYREAAKHLTQDTGQLVFPCDPFISTLFEWTCHAIVPAWSRIQTVAKHLLRVRIMKGEAVCAAVLGVEGPWKRKLLKALDEGPGL